MALLLGAALIAALGWRWQMQHLATQLKATREGLKKLALTAGVAPDRAVMAYLTRRQAACEQRYQQAVEALSPPPLPPAALADPQLFFQQRLHEMTQALERLAAAREMAVPQTLGFPKELPPPEVVPRLLVQLQLLQEAAALVVDQGVAALLSLKIDDPEPVRPPGAAEVLLTRLPVRVRLTCTLPQLLKIMAAADRAAPLMDFKEVRVASRSTEEALDVECVLARYLPAPAGAGADAPAGKAKEPTRPVRKTREQRGRLSE
jgi:hypothetical protein